MRVLERVRNVLGQPTGDSSRLWPAGMVALLLPLGFWAALALTGITVADDDDRDVIKPGIKREHSADEAELRFTVRKAGDKPVLREERVIEQKIIGKDGKLLEHKISGGGKKPRVSLELVASEEVGPREERRLDELTALVTRLSAQVERLQDEVAELRGGSASNKRPVERRVVKEEDGRLTQRLRKQEEQLQQATQEAQLAKELTAREQERAKERAAEAGQRAKERAAEAKERAAEQKERVAEQKERAARERERAAERTERERERSRDEAERSREGKERTGEPEERVKRKSADDNAFNFGDKFRELSKLAELTKWDGFKFAEKDIAELAKNAADEAVKIAAELSELSEHDIRKEAEAATNKAFEAIKRAVERKKEWPAEKEESPKKKTLKPELDGENAESRR